jgi:light-regulated signal transduction histidine kinase (bacteriophytochrome)
MDVTAQTLHDQLMEARAEIERLNARIEEMRFALADAQQAEKEGREAARLAGEELQQFVYAASHDLQEPLRTVSAYAQLLQREYPQEGQAAEFTAFIISGANQMSALVRDLLTYSRIRTEPNQEPFRLGTALQRALLTLSERIGESGAQVTWGELPEVFADEGQISNVFEHLISNGIRYRSSASPVIRITVEQEPEMCTVSVQDNGLGIEPRFHELVFQAFKRLHGKDLGGTGLGLTMCRKIVRAHGGRIWVESDGQHGSTFKFTLPL